MELLLLLCLCLLTRSGVTSAQHNGPAPITVEEDRDVMLPCSLSNKGDITLGVFDWKKDGADVFFYANGQHSNTGRGGQIQQFIGRVSHFEEELKHGNASITIRNTKVADSGNYTCFFPNLRPPQTFKIELVVDRVLKNRSGENIPGAAPKPFVTIRKTKDEFVLQCEVHGSPKPKVEWLDSAGNILPAEEPQVSERGGRFYITLTATVTETDDYRCVATQETISHQIYAEIYFNGDLQPSVKTVSQTNDRAVLQCKIRGASADLKVEWQDNAGNKIAAKEPQFSERGDSHDVTLQTTVTKTGHYHCVASQKKINHTMSADTFVHISGLPIVGIVGWIVAAVLAVVILAALVAKYKKRSKKQDPKSSTTGTEGTRLASDSGYSLKTSA